MVSSLICRSGDIAGSSAMVSDGSGVMVNRDSQFLRLSDHEMPGILVDG